MDRDRANGMEERYREGMNAIRTARVDNIRRHILRGDLWRNSDFWDDVLDLCGKNGLGRSPGVNGATSRASDMDARAARRIL